MGECFPRLSVSDPGLVENGASVRVLICGDRGWTDQGMIALAMHKLLLAIGPPTDHLIIHGAYRGADRLAEAVATRLGIPVNAHPAKWSLFGLAAGPRRNREMLDAGPHEVWAFHDDLEHSKGTKDMLAQARAAGIPVRHFAHESRSA